MDNICVHYWKNAYQSHIILLLAVKAGLIVLVRPLGISKGLERLRHHTEPCKLVFIVPLTHLAISPLDALVNNID